MKKKKLEKLSLDTMMKGFRPIDEETLRKISGGGYVGSYSINGGTITNWSYDGENFAVFTSNDGRTVVLDGVHVGNNTICFQQANTACYWAGEIRIGSQFTNFSFDTLMHEYGHYLQEQESFGSFLSGIPGSVISAWIENPNHMDMPYEQDATSRGNSYAASYYGYH